MKRRLCKATPNRKSIKRADTKYQMLWNEMSGSIEVDRLKQILSILEPLPHIHPKGIMIRNKKGVLVESIGTKGRSKKIGVDRCGGVVYFDGNRIGKRKQAMYDSFYGLDGAAFDKFKGHSEAKVWAKIKHQAF